MDRQTAQGASQSFVENGFNGFWNKSFFSQIGEWVMLKQLIDPYNYPIVREKH